MKMKTTTPELWKSLSIKRPEYSPNQQIILHEMPKENNWTPEVWLALSVEERRTNLELSDMQVSLATKDLLDLVLQNPNLEHMILVQDMALACDFLRYRFNGFAEVINRNDFTDSLLEFQHNLTLNKSSLGNKNATYLSLLVKYLMNAPQVIALINVRQTTN